MRTACRTCDGNGKSVKRDEDNIVVSESTCSRCGGTGDEPGPSKGGKRRGKRQKLDDEDAAHEDAVRAFLAKHNAL